MLTFGLNLPAASFATCNHSFDVSIHNLLLSPTLYRDRSFAPASRLWGGGFRLTYQSLGLLNVLVSKQKLAIEIRKIDSVQIHNVNLAEAGQNQILQQLAANASRAYHEYAGGLDGGGQRDAEALRQVRAPGWRHGERLDHWRSFSEGV
jgi:hypothetical protein